MYRILMSIGLIFTLPFIVIGLVNFIARFNTSRHWATTPRPATAPPPPTARRPSKKDPAQALAEIKPRISAKEEELAALRAEEFRLSLETGRIRDPYRGGVTDDCVQMPALTDDVLRDASKGKA